MPRKSQFEDPTFEETTAAAGAVQYQPQEGLSADTVLRRHEAELMALPGVKGVGETRNEIGDPAIMVYLSNQSAALKVPSQLNGLEVVTTVVGEVDAYGKRNRGKG
jgi:hypothetical protein